MAYIKARHNKLQASIRVPKDMEERHGGRKHLYRTLEATGKRAAKVEAMAWEAGVRAEWETLRGNNGSSTASLRLLYETFLDQARRGEFKLSGDPQAYNEITAGIEHELGRMADEIGPRKLTKEEEAKVWAFNDAMREQQGRRVKPRNELEPTFRDLADDYIALWRSQAGLKQTNTEQQKLATFDLFAAFFGDKSIRAVGRADGANFVDALRQLDPNWARTGKPRGERLSMSWAEIQRKFGGRSRGLSDATTNRHVATLSAFWKWAEEREYCEGRNPFDGHRKNLKEGRNKRGYVAWESAELQKLFSPPPKRDDLAEVMMVALFTGMRLNEIVSLTNQQVMEVDGIPCLDITDAKTMAGIRKVPLHPCLLWLRRRAQNGEPSSRVWPRFSNEGPGRQPSGDAGKEFGRFKKSRGYEGRQKAFHSFRKNVVGQLQAAGIPQHEVAELVGHETQGMTFGTYGKGQGLQRMAEIVKLLEYPGVHLPKPSGKRPN